jgi:hypothetical protein
VSKFVSSKGGYFERYQGDQAETDQSLSDKRQGYGLIGSAGGGFDRKDPASDRAFQDPQEGQPFAQGITDDGFDPEEIAELFATNQLRQILKSNPGT